MTEADWRRLVPVREDTHRHTLARRRHSAVLFLQAYRATRHSQ